jgi:branched-chain amino acid aminotransferase
VAPAAGVKVREVALRPEDLPTMAECFVLSTTKDLVPVGAIDEHRFQTGAGTLTRKLKDAFVRHALGYAHAHPELRLF